MAMYHHVLTKMVGAPFGQFLTLKPIFLKKYWTQKNSNITNNIIPLYNFQNIFDMCTEENTIR